ncbi:aldo/keto reductase [Pelagibacterium sediminicola]|uniref:aldo/keto reductase n=1 Tax=Pelagibacterium sediminicola TaxID=2248761 RepID=UPI000E30D173|nr:aldo/keto reductase [Pelagibacterium sediminicola]
MSDQTFITLNDGVVIPQLGLGTWRIGDDEAVAVVREAFRLGYRHIDTAQGYGNERGVGRAVAEAGLLREEVFITSKLRNGEHGFDETLRAFEGTMERLGLDVLDLYLIHWPSPAVDRYVESWKAFIRLREEGRIRSIGVSNFNPDHLERIIGETGVTPSVNQIELHPCFQRRDLRDVHAGHGIAIESWSPLGRGNLLGDPVIASVAQKHGRTPGQVAIRWHIEQGLIVFPKTGNPARLAENFNVFDFTLDAEDMARIATLDQADGRTGPDPLLFP